jgi:hypothetical protein
MTNDIRRIECPLVKTLKEFEYSGYKCIIRNHARLKYLMGYVKIPKGHKYYRVPIDNLAIECHGGLTFGEVMGDYYIIGFDCCHAFDFDNIKPKDKKDFNYPLGIPNKDEKYVIENIKKIVDQLDKES